MAKRPLVIAFDVIETMFPLEPVRQRLIDAGQPGHLLELWFARLLRDGFALVASNSYQPADPRHGHFSENSRSDALTPRPDVTRTSA